MPQAAAVLLERSVGSGVISAKKLERELLGMTDGRKIHAIMKRDMMASARPALRELQARIMAIPTHGLKHSGLRARIAGVARLKEMDRGTAEVWIRLYMAGNEMPDGEKALPAYMDGAKPRWRHPVYGDRENWVPQEAHPYFYEIAEHVTRRSRDAVVNDGSRAIVRDIT